MNAPSGRETIGDLEIFSSTNHVERQLTELAPLITRTILRLERLRTGQIDDIVISIVGVRGNSNPRRWSLCSLSSRAEKVQVGDVSISSHYKNT